MSMDPTKWVDFDKLSERTQQRIQTVYPYLKLDHCVFQDKHSGVFMKQTNNVKIEKLLDPEDMSAPRRPAAAAGSGGGRARKQ